MEPTFPLFRLPGNVIVQVLKSSDFSQLFIASLVSSKSKNLVTSLGLRASDVTIYISHEIGLRVIIGSFRLNLVFRSDSNDQNAPFDITRSISASYLHQHQTFQPSTPFNFSDWLNHIRSVFWFTVLEDVEFGPGCERFEMESLKNTLKNVNYLAITEDITDVQSELILKSFNTPNELSLVFNPFEESCEIQKCFIQNFELIEFHDVNSLDDMLLVNGETVKFIHPIPPKQFNQFVKHWIRGSNPRLQAMSQSIDNTKPATRDALLKGIHFVDVEEEEHQEICRKHTVASDNMVRIRRNDGRPAAITTKAVEKWLLDDQEAK